MTTSTDPTPVDLPSAGGVTVQAYRWDPEGEPTAVVRLTHGMGEHALRYGHLAGQLTARGWVVYAQDHRGHGATARRAGTEPGVIGADGWTELVEDVGRLGALARDAHPGLPHVLLGHSMGSFATQQFLLGHADDVDAVVLTGTAAIDLLEPALDLDAPIDLSAFNAPFAPARTDYDWLSRDEAQVDAYVADPLCGFGLDGAGGKQMFVAARPLADAEVLDALPDGLPVLVAVGTHDPVGGDLALVNALVSRYTAAGLDVTLLTYDGARHEVFNETNRDEVEADVVGWIASVVAPGPAA
ncbi:Lysophospholipase, alpha-beta hydrolase superfamily [Nocardioides scoriae]|uniref:Lysophospholipase, alpha-beta hydrolase superfamily n=1 Tax=Nocardioides scoriae TaxID=642780 RepID=A0A1H1R1F7_9ACTN|nr:alpha/beta hydrolase [Nocardioides scoriae]SDS29470.1 Lysophospholipase, alpha-beta hydrolase superfamily [Nocardioides scoriae]